MYCIATFFLFIWDQSVNALTDMKKNFLNFTSDSKNLKKLKGIIGDY